MDRNEYLNELQEALGLTENMSSETRQGIVVWFECDYDNKTIHETGRTKILPWSLALDYYSEVPNPASQIIGFDNEEEMVVEETELQNNIKDRKWLDELFECI